MDGPPEPLDEVGQRRPLEFEALAADHDPKRWRRLQMDDVSLGGLRTPDFAAKAMQIEGGGQGRKCGRESHKCGQR
jgi:hypothetical protein